MKFILESANGDSRILLNTLEVANKISPHKTFSISDIETAFQKKQLQYDMKGEEHYNTISAFIPIPVLDGGHIVMLLVEKIRRRPLSERTILLSQRIGMAFIVILMALALYNDIFRLIDGKPLP